MTVSELIAELQKEDPNAKVGVSATYVHGWVQDVRGLAIAPDGTICIDQKETSLFEDEENLDRI